MLQDKVLETLSEYGSSIFAFCVYLTGNKYTAEEIYQDSFIVLLEKKHKYCPEKMSSKEMRNYLMAIATNLWKNKWKKQRRRELISDENHLFSEFSEACTKESPEDYIIRKEKNTYIRRCIRELSPKLQQVILLHYSADLKTAEIARILDIPETTVRSRLFKARAKIKKEMEEKYYES